MACLSDDDKTVWVWDAMTVTGRRWTVRAHDSREVICVALSAVEKRVVSGSSNMTMGMGRGDR